MRRICRIRRIFFAAALCLSAAVTAAGACGAGEHPWTNKRIHYIVEQQGFLVEKGSFVRRPGSFRKQPCIVTEEERYIFNPANPAAPERLVRTRTMTTIQGAALQRTEAPGGQAANRDAETLTVENGEALFDASGAYGRPGRVPVPSGVLFEITGDYLATLRGRRGDTHTASVLDRATRGVVATEILLSGQEREAGEMTPGVFLADISTPGRPVVTAWYTPDGRLMRLEGGGMAYQVVPRDAYELGQIPPRGIGEEEKEQPVQFLADRGENGTANGSANAQPGFSPANAANTGANAAPPPVRGAGARIPIGASVPAWDSFARLLLDAAPAFEWNNALSTSEYAHISLNGVSVAVSALRNAPVANASAEFPMNIPPDIMPYLLASELIPSDHGAVVEAAYAAVADSETKREERNVLRAVSFLAGWVNQNVAVEEWGGYASSALTTLAARSGDSLGHARLFSAMARTLGVPTRLCQGFLARSDGAVNHCWAEAWIAGRWIPVDTTVSRVGLPAGYVLAERGQGNGEFRFDFVNFMRSPGLGLRLVAAGRETPSGAGAELVVGDRRTYAFSENDWLTNLYWGFALRLPDGWQGRARLNSVELASPGGAASVRCEALRGDFKAGLEELEETVASLRESLDEFDLVEGRVTAFDADGATPAMFIDFTCDENGKNLRCRQYVVPRRGRAFRLSFWAPEQDFHNYAPAFDAVLASVEL